MIPVFESPLELLGQDGAVLGTSEWVLIDQSRVDAFAAATGDFQWIHVDVDRARSSPFRGTIAHGYLTLSLLGSLLPQILEVRGFSMGVNVGCDRLRFLAPVPVGARLRASGQLISAEEIKGAVQSVVRVTIEIEGGAKPACVVDTISRYFLA